MPTREIVEYRDKAHLAEWKRSYGTKPEEIYRLNKIIGYEKYRVRVSS